VGFLLNPGKAVGQIGQPIDVYPVGVAKPSPIPHLTLLFSPNVKEAVAGIRAFPPSAGQAGGMSNEARPDVSDPTFFNGAIVVTHLNGTVERVPVRLTIGSDAEDNSPNET
jgi:hypothetical protein